MKDITGQRFSRLTVLRFANNHLDLYPKWWCRCDCGNELAVFYTALVAKKKGEGTKSCGCLKRESNTTHGFSQSPTYSSWCSMIQRCFNPNSPDWNNYGGRGITVCERWRQFSNFLADMGERPLGTSIERVRNWEGYKPHNCVWANAKVQRRNTRTNRYLEFQGMRRCLSDWCYILKLPYNAVSNRLQVGWSVEDALTKPIRKQVNAAPIAKTRSKPSIYRRPSPPAT